MSKVVLVSIDGMRADAPKICKSSFVGELMERGSYTFTAKTVYPSVTLPCHLSLFYSQPPQRHGTQTNTYVSPVRPINGLFEQLYYSGKRSATYTGWEPMRNISRADEILFASEYIRAYSFDHTDAMLTDSAIRYMKLAHPDFVFLHQVETDEKGGHDTGWMSETYLDYVRLAFENVRRIYEEFGDEYQIIITADHGGHDRCHGTDAPEDMTIPMFFLGTSFESGQDLGEISILDIAPTVAKIIGIQPVQGWEGKSVV